MRKFRLLALIYITFVNVFFSQENVDILPSNVNVKTPQAYEISRYGNIPIKLGVGETDINISLLSMLNKYLNIDVSLSYNSGGFLPFKSPGIVGLNWNLNVGGVINRKVNGVFDEYISEDPTTKFDGFLTGVRKDRKNKTCFYDFSCLNIGGLNLGIGNGKTGRYEGEPDLFTFSFMGYYGEFMVGNDGVPVVKSSSGNLKVDLSGVASYNDKFIFLNRPSSTIILYDDKGTKYYFGETIDSREFTVNFKDLFNVGQCIADTPTVNNSWYLTKIELPNKEIIDFEYEKLSYNTTNLSDRSVSSLTSNKKFLKSYYFINNTNYSVSTEGCFGYSGCWRGSTSSGDYGTTYQFQKKSFLKEIRYNNKKIVFTYKDLGYKFINYHDVLKNGNEFAIDNIVLSDGSKEINKVVFDYDIKGGSYPRTFLKSVLSNIDQIYKFEYFKTDNLPSPNTYGTDHWGFWNGTNPSQPIWPAHYLNNETGEYSITGTEKNTSTDLFDVSLLSKITYPTKGYTEFHYEPHSYSKRIERNYQSQFLRGVYNNSGIAGGARIMQIIDKDINGTITQSKSIKYVENIDSSVSSGLLLNWPRYLYSYRQTVNNSSGTYVNNFYMFWSSSSIIENSFENANVYYKKVYEVVEGKGYKENIFSSYEDTPDEDSNLNNYKIVFYNNEEDAKNSLKPYDLVKNLYGGVNLNSKANFRGLLLNENIYDNSKKLIKSITNLYNIEFDKNSLSKYVVVNHESGKFYSQNYKYYLNYPQIIKTITKDSLGNATVETIVEKTFDIEYQNNLLTNTLKSSDGNSLKTEMSYAYEKNNQYLIDKNMIGIPLQTTVSKNNLGISSVESKYPISQTDADAKTNGLALPTSVISYGLQIPGASSSSKTEVTYDKYDDKGNILQYTVKGLRPTVIIWGYNQTQPIAKIEGISYDALMALSGVSPLINDTITKSNSDATQGTIGSEQSLLTSLDSLRTSSSLNAYMISTYTYDPLIGVTSITPPSGIREIYKYDSANRLQSVVDVNGKILKEYQYNYKQ